MLQLYDTKDIIFMKIVNDGVKDMFHQRNDDLDTFATGTAKRGTASWLRMCTTFL